MKFNKRQIKILGVASFVTFLVLPVSFVVVKNLSQTDNSKNNYENPKPITPPPIDNNLRLVEAKNISIYSVQTFQTNYHVSDGELVNKLKSADRLFSSDDWRDYFKKETEISKINNKLTLVSQLASKVFREKNPIPSIPHYDNIWERNLAEVRNHFITTNPSSLQEIKDWLVSKSYPQPLEGIELNPSDENLRKIKSSLSPLLAKQGGKWEKYIQLQASGDGNCFVNSFSVLLTGKNLDKSLSIRLKLAMCWEIIYNLERYYGEKENTKQVNWIKEKLIDEGFATNGEWLENYHGLFLANILKRKIVVISVDISNRGTWNAVPFSPLDNQYPEPFFIFNSGGHFQPLLRPKDHNEGQISFKSQSIDIDNVNHSILFTFDPSTLKKSGFTSTNEIRFNNIFSGKSKIRILYNFPGVNTDEANEEFNRIIEDKLKEKERDVYIRMRDKSNYDIKLFKTQGIQVYGDEIHLNYDCYEEIDYNLIFFITWGYLLNNSWYLPLSNINIHSNQPNAIIIHNFITVLKIRDTM